MSTHRDLAVAYLPGPLDGSCDQGRDALMHAQALALLEIAEQLRIANLIALEKIAPGMGAPGLFTPDVCFVCDEHPCMEEDHAFHPEPTEMRKDVADALGLETSDE